MVKIIIHCAFILLFLVSVGINVAFFTGSTTENIDLKNTVEQLRAGNIELRATVERFRIERDRLRLEREEIDRRLNESVGNAKEYIRDAIRTVEEIESEIKKSGD